MKTLDREKSEKLFHEFNELGMRVSQLGSIVQNPDFVNNENARECFKDFYKVCHKCSRDLDDLYVRVSKLYEEVLN